jgi:hypothetical protein
MNDIVPQGFGAVSARFAGVQAENDLSAGVQSGFGILGYKGKVWSTRYRGTETPLMRPDGDGPRGSVEVVILRASGHVSKIWYEHGYVEGSTAAPDCFSANGVTPDAGSKKRQAATCAACPMNAWGSRITPAGKQGKACSDSKRLAVVPLGDLKNEAMGGAMLLRVPAASLRELAQFGEKMQALGYPYYAIGTRIAFDPQEAYPKFLFSAIRPLTDAEADAVLAMRDQQQITTLLAEGSENTASQPPQAAQVAAAFEQPPVQPAPVQPAPVQPAPVQPTPVQQVVAPPTAPAAPTNGFGGADPVTPQVTQSAPAPAQVAPAAPEAPQSAFEDALDAKMEELLGPA